METRLLSQEDLISMMDMAFAVDHVESAFTAHGRGDVQMPHKIYLSLPHVRGDFRAMPSYISGAAGVKWVNSHVENTKRHGLPTVMAMFILSDPDTALPLAIMDASLITAYRTGAAGAVATKYLADPKAKTLGIVGCGVQAKYLLEAHRVLHDDWEVRVTDIVPERAQAFALKYNVNAVALEEACAADVVCTATPGLEPTVKLSWLRQGALVNAIGADAPGKQELETEVIAKAQVIVDDLEQASASGEVNVPLTQNAIKEADIAATLGEIVAGKKAKKSNARVTVFDSTGLAIQDLALAHALYLRACERNVGQRFAFMPYTPNTLY